MAKMKPAELFDPPPLLLGLAGVLVAIETWGAALLTDSPYSDSGVIIRAVVIGVPVIMVGMLVVLPYRMIRNRQREARQDH